MTTIPARLAQVARTSASPEEAAARARTLYRTWYRGVSYRTFQLFAGESPSRDQQSDMMASSCALRSTLIRPLLPFPPNPSPHNQAPEIIDMYQIPISVYDLRTKVREQFEKNKHVTDIRVADVLLLKGRQEYQETINYWKTPVRPPPPCFDILSARGNHRLGCFVADDVVLSSHTSWAGSTNKRCASQPHPPTPVPFADPSLPYSRPFQDNCEVSITFVAREVFIRLTSFPPSTFQLLHQRRSWTNSSLGQSFTLSAPSHPLSQSV